MFRAGVGSAQCRLTPTPPAGAPGNWKPTLGSILQITQDVNTLGYNFQCGTTVSWAGIYNPPIGADSTPFTIDWDEPDVTIDSNWQLRVLLGGGVVTNMPTAIESLMPGGTLDGTLTVTTPCPADFNCDGILDLGDINAFQTLFLASDLRADMNGDGILDNGDLGDFVTVYFLGCSPPVVIPGATSLAIDMDAGQFQMIHYPGGYLNGSPPMLVGRGETVSIIYGAFSEAEENLRVMYGSHFAVTVELESNELSDDMPPATLVADVISLDTSMNVVDSITGLLLTRVSGGNGEPHLYTSNLNTPIMVFENALSYAPTTLIPIQAVDSGHSVVVVR